MTSPLRVATSILVIAALGTGCNGLDEDVPVAEHRDERMEGVEGLTAEELEREGEPLTQEEALERGVLDTTIYIEPLDPDEPLAPDDPFEVGDPDTVPPRDP